jgi:tetratricopeptide (TPR) repeat protein
MRLERADELLALDALLDTGGALVIEGAVGIGKTSLITAGCERAGRRGWRVLRGGGSELETGFALGVVRQLFERELAAADPAQRTKWLAGPAEAVRGLLAGPARPGGAPDPFAVVHGLYWLTVNMAARRPLLIAVDDAHWADPASLRWLAYLTGRVEGLDAAVVVALRPAEPASKEEPLLAIRAAAPAIRPALLSAAGVAAVVRAALGPGTPDAQCQALRDASGGNPFYLAELLRVQASGTGEVAAGLARVEVLATADPPCFLHPVVRAAVDASLDSAERHRAHRSAARELDRDDAAPGQVAAHLMRVQPAGDAWAAGRLRRAARSAIAAGAPAEAAQLLRRALAEPPPSADRVGLLRELAAADAAAGRQDAAGWLAEALALTSDPVERAAIARELARTYAAMFRWAEAVDATDWALAELGDRDRRWPRAWKPSSRWPGCTTPAGRPGCWRSWTGSRRAARLRTRPRRSPSRGAWPAC